jgi:hypothetical protein
MENYEKLVCEFSSLRLDRTTTTEKLRFELYDVEEQHHNHDCNFIKKLFSNETKKYHGSSKMRLEISIRNNNNARTSEHVEQLHHHCCKNSTPVMEADCKSGTRLLHVLNKWYDYRVLNNNNNKLNFEQMKKSWDYEL